MAVDLPAPEKPVITTRSCSREVTTGWEGTSGCEVAGTRRSPPRNGRRGRLIIATRTLWPPSRTSPGLRSDSPRPVKVAIQLPRDLGRQPRHRLQLLDGGRHHRLGRAEVAQQSTLARRPDARQLIEQRAAHRPVAPAAVVGDGKAVSL